MARECSSETPSTLTVACFFLLSLPSLFASETVEELRPTVLIAVPVRNKAHSLPYFLQSLENLDYPKERIALWFRSDHNVDNSSVQVATWLDHVKPLYHSIDFRFDDSQTRDADQKGPSHWSRARFSHVMHLRQQGLDAGRRLWADFVLMIDADVILKNPKTLQLLVKQDKTIVAPLMNVTSSDNYANFWGDMDDEGYYKRSSDYFAIKERQELGCFVAAMVHSVLLINLRHGVSQRLAYYPPPQKYAGPHDDIIVFAHSAKYNGVRMHVLNTEFFGYLPLPMEAHNTVSEEAEQFVHIKTESIVDDAPLPRVAYLYPPPIVQHKDLLGFDQVYMINLKRRPDRKEKMIACFEEYGIDFKYVEAVDGKLLNDSYLESLNVRMLPGYSDPYHGRPLTKGEIGCFLSHYFIWLDIIKNGYKKVVVFEDDIRFEPYFRRRLGYIMEEVDYLRLDWDLIMRAKMETYVRNSKKLVHPDYSYWMMGYALSGPGARKLVAADPLRHLMALDEFINVLLNKQPSYLGRKKLRWTDEFYVAGSERLVYPHYSYWTLAFLLTRQGVDKLMSHDPLRNLMPIDEYIPILFDRHIEEEWKKQFTRRDLIGLSVEPLLVYPTRYTGEPGYITDTDHSEVIEFGEDGYISKNPKKPHKPERTLLEPTARPSGNHRHGERGDMEDLHTTNDEL